MGKASRDGAGWHVCLDVLEHHLAGQEPPRSNKVHWQDVHDRYVERFGPEASTMGPPEGCLRHDGGVLVERVTTPYSPR